MERSPRIMIGLKSKEWDVILGALLQAKNNEWDEIERGCECNDECDLNNVWEGCYDETQIHIITDLWYKVDRIKKAMIHFEEVILERMT